MLGNNNNLDAYRNMLSYLCYFLASPMKQKKISRLVHTKDLNDDFW